MADNTTKDDDLMDLAVTEDTEVASLNDIETLDEPEIEEIEEEELDDDPAAPVYFDDISDDSVRLYLREIEIFRSIFNIRK